jgi:hypothetical protein
MKRLLGDVRWNDDRTRWLLENAAAGLGLESPPQETEEFEWATGAFSVASAMTLYLAARKLVDVGRQDEALEVLSDACQAQLSSCPTVPAIRVRTGA